MDDAQPLGRRSHPRLTILALLLAPLSLGPSAPCLSAEAAPSPERWTFRLTASLMAADHSGTTETVRGRTVGGNIIFVTRDYSDLYPGHQPLYLVDLAANHGRWGVSVRGQFFDWGNEVLLENRTLVAETMRFAEADVSHSVGEHWRFLIGFRYVEIEHTEQILHDYWPPDWPVDISRWGQTWLDLVVGASFRYALAARWELSGRGDFGVLGVGSDLTWNLEAAVQWRIAQHVALVGGYRAYDVYFAEKNTYSFPIADPLTVTETYDTHTSGPTLGLTFHW